MAALLLLFVGVEGARWLSFYQHVSRAQHSLTRLERELSLSTLPQSPQSIADAQARLQRAEADLRAAEDHLHTDPLMASARLVPWLGAQATGVTEVIRLAHSTVSTAVLASGVLVAYGDHEDDPSRTALQDGVAFLDDQAEAVAEVRRSLERTAALRARIPDQLLGPIARRRDRVEDALGQIDTLVTGYEEAHALLPDLLGLNEPRTYLLLAQNDTELFPSGGLISNYGIVTFENGQLAGMRFEYFADLFGRWQKTSGGEYVEPPLPLKQYLLRDTSWALGEAGWYPDFPTTAALARSFVERGGASAPDGVIAIDLRFMEALLRELGPVTVGDQGNVRVAADNLDDVLLERTRSEALIPGSPGKAFLSSLAEEVVRKVLATPREQWLTLVGTLGRMGRERHLQLHFTEQRLQDLAVHYGFDGGLVDAPGDSLLLADTSVNSTKLNLILRNTIEVDVRLDGADARSNVAYTIDNPFEVWSRGRDPQLVRALMLDGRYGSYLRLYAPEQARLTDLRADGQSVGPQQVDIEHGRRVFGRYTPVAPGTITRLEFQYDSPGIVDTLDDGSRRYRLYVQKQPGTTAVPLAVDVRLPKGADLRSITLDGRPAALPLVTDLRTDRVIEVVYRLAP